MEIMNSNLQGRLTDVGLLMIRVMLAVVFMYHGSQMLFGWFGGFGLQATAGFMEKIGIPYPLVGAILSGATEFFGGLVLLIGTGTRIAAIPMAFNMAVACLTAHHGFNATTGGMEYPLTLGVILVSLVLMGPGRITVAMICSCCRETEVRSQDSEEG